MIECPPYISRGPTPRSVVMIMINITSPVLLGRAPAAVSGTTRLLSAMVDGAPRPMETRTSAIRGCRSAGSGQRLPSGC
jgi:hypothetical protein